MPILSFQLPYYWYLWLRVAFIHSHIHTCIINMTEIEFLFVDKYVSMCESGNWLLFLFHCVSTISEKIRRLATFWFAHNVVRWTCIYKIR